MSALVKTITKGLFHSLGLEIQRMPPFRAYEWLRDRSIRTVFDIGANTGQFARYVHGILPDAFIYSFEPLAQCYRELVRTMAHVRRFRSFPCALSDEDGRLPMYHNEFSPSSSLLPLEDLHKHAFPYAREANTEYVDVRRLDDVADDLEVVGNVLVKIDVQGTEDRVIQGGDRTISRSSILILETAFRPLYRGQVLFDAIYDSMRAKGFAFAGCEGFIRDPRNGSVLQCDSVFVRGAGEP